MSAEGGSDARELHALYARLGPGLRRFCARRVGEAEAEDLVHDVFERAHRAAGAADAGPLTAAWLYRIARNAAVDRLRSRAVRGREEVAEALRPADDEPPLPDGDLERARTRQCIRGLVDRLAPNHREVVALSELQGLSDRETADALGLTLGAAKIRLHRARRALRALVECECRTFRDERNELGCEPVRAEGPRVVA